MGPTPARAVARADYALLRMGGHENLVVPLAFMFSAELSRNAVRENLQTRLAPYHQFTHRIERRWLRARWVPDAAFSINRHLDEVRLPPGSGSDELRAWISREVCKPLANDRPLWHATLVHEIDGRSALVMRVHHALADGMSLMHLVSRMTDIAPGAQFLQPMRAREREDLSVGVLLRHAPRVLADALQMLFMRNDRNKLKGRLGRAKSVAWSDALSLAAAREIARRHGATVNDVMLAVIAGALRRYLRAQDQTVVAGPLRAVIPINIRPHRDSDRLGNQFGLVGLELPVHLADPLQCLLAVRDAMTALKRGFQGHLALALVRCAGLLPPRLQQLVLGFFLRRCTAVVTNVIGPAEARSVAGLRMDALIGFVPQTMTVGVGVSIISYNDTVRICFLVDEKLMPDCSAAAASIRGCFEELRYAACTPPAAAVQGQPAGSGDMGRSRIPVVRTRRVKAIDLGAEAVLPPAIDARSIPPARLAAPDSILLTGATGYLGAHLLADLLCRTDARIHCLVRARSAEEGRQRLEGELIRRFPEARQHMSRIVPIAGNLAKPGLGVTADEFRALASEIDVVYHSGASTHLLTSYKILKPANVLATEEVLRLASTIRSKVVHFVSSFSVFMSPHCLKLASLPEQEGLEHWEGLPNGYVQSKWVSDRLTQQAVSRGIPVCIYRPGFISGHSRTGECKLDGLPQRLIKGCIQLGMAPHVPDGSLDMTPVDFVGPAIVHLSQRSDSLGKAFHLVNPAPIAWHRLVEWIRSFGYPLEMVSDQEWLQELRGVDDSNALHSLQALLESTPKELLANLPPFERRNSIAGLSENSIICPSVEDLLDTYFSFFIESGFLSLPGRVQAHALTRKRPATAAE